MRETAAAIDEAALAWAVRFPLDEGEEQALEVWLAGDRRRRGALARALAGWAMLDRAQAAPPQPTLAPVPRMALPHRRWIVGAVGSGIAAALGATMLLPSLRGKRERTALGEVRRLPLSDGSLAAINTDSQIDIALGRDLRRIDLVQGEAWFDVAKDPRRPFVVEAGGVRVRAVGTAFSVRRKDASALVSVTEGVVLVSRGDDGAPLPLRAGERVELGRSGPVGRVEETPAVIERALAWRTGEIVLEGETLADAVAEMNRYNSRKIAIAQPALAGERLVGLYSTNDPEGFARSVSLLLNLRISRTDDVILLSNALPS